MYQILNLSPREDNECATSQGFSCCSVVLGVYVCLCAHVSARTGEEKARRRVCGFLMNVCVLAGWRL